MKARYLLLTTAMSLSMNLSFSDSLESLTSRKFKETDTYKSITDKAEQKRFRRGRKDYNRIRKGFDQMEKGAGEMHGYRYDTINENGEKTSVLGKGLIEERASLESQNLKGKDKRKAFRELNQDTRKARRSARRGNRKISKQVKRQSNKMLRYLRKNYDPSKDSADTEFYNKFFGLPDKPYDQLDESQKAKREQAETVIDAYKTAHSNKKSKSKLGRLFHGKKKMRKDFLEAMEIDSKKVRRKWAQGKLEENNDMHRERYGNAMDFIQLGNPNYMTFLEKGNLDLLQNRKQADGVGSATGDYLIETPSKKRTEAQLKLGNGQTKLGERLDASNEQNLADAANDPGKPNVSNKSQYEKKDFDIKEETRLAAKEVKPFIPTGTNAKSKAKKGKGRKGFSKQRVESYNATRSADA